MTKFKQFFEDLIWNIKSFIYQPFVHTVTMDYVITQNGSYSSNNMLTDKYVYYWIGDFKTGKAVKVKSIDVLRHEYKMLETKMMLIQED